MLNTQAVTKLNFFELYLFENEPVIYIYENLSNVRNIQNEEKNVLTDSTLRQNWKL